MMNAAPSRTATSGVNQPLWLAPISPMASLRISGRPRRYRTAARASAARSGSSVVSTSPPDSPQPRLS